MSKSKTPLWETIAIFAAIVCLWPALLRYWATNSSITLEELPLSGLVDWSHPAWNALMYIALAVMVLIAVMRMRRVGHVKEDAKDDRNSDGPIDPYGSMLGNNKEEK